MSVNFPWHVLFNNNGASNYWIKFWALPCDLTEGWVNSFDGRSIATEEILNSGFRETEQCPVISVLTIIINLFGCNCILLKHFTYHLMRRLTTILRSSANFINLFFSLFIFPYSRRSANFINFISLSFSLFFFPNTSKLKLPPSHHSQLLCMKAKIDYSYKRPHGPVSLTIMRLLQRMDPSLYSSVSAHFIISA